MVLANITCMHYMSSHYICIILWMLQNIVFSPICLLRDHNKHFLFLLISVIDAKNYAFHSFSLDSEFLASTSTDGSARIWKTDDGVPLTTLTRNSVRSNEDCYICSIVKYILISWGFNVFSAAGRKN